MNSVEGAIVCPRPNVLGWWIGWDSNPQAVRLRIYSPLRIPIPPPILKLTKLRTVLQQNSQDFPADYLHSIIFRGRSHVAT